MFVLKSTHDRIVSELVQKNEDLVAENHKVAVASATAIQANFAFDFSKASVFSIERVDTRTIIAFPWMENIQEWELYLTTFQHNNLVAAWKSGATGVVVV